MKIAVVGCSHGELEKIYNQIQVIEEHQNIKIDLLLCCGDFQSTRNEGDLRCMAVPPKYYNMGSFYKYYSGDVIAPVLTVFIGGNHEASNYLQELPYGGWVAPRIYYMGYAGIVNFRGVRIGGLSGIFKGVDYMKGHFEKSPYNENSKRSVYHIRNVEVFKLKQISKPLDIMMSHDWPRGVYNFGSKEYLLRKKPFFEKEVNENNLGSKPTEELLFHLKSKYWFSAHLHTKFGATVPHKSGDGTVVCETNFLALDKCLPRRKWLEVIDVPSSDDSMELSYDLEWLTILHLTNHLMCSKVTNQYMPGPSSDERWCFTPTAVEEEFVQQKMNNDLKIPENFFKTAHPFDKFNRNGRIIQPEAVVNPQTVTFCDRLGISDPMSNLIEYCVQELPSPPAAYSTPERSEHNDSTYLSFDNSYASDSSSSLSSLRSSLSNSFTCSSPMINLPKKPKLSFPSLKEKTNDSSSSADYIPFNIDRSGSAVEPSPRKIFKRRNADLYTEQTEEC